MIVGSCSPMAMNTIALMAQMTICQAPLPSSRASGESTRAAREHAYAAADVIRFDGRQLRRDIAI